MSSDTGSSPFRRRRFLQAVGAITVSTGLVGAENAPDGTEYDPENEVPRLHGWKHTNHEEVINTGAPPKREPFYEAISREHWRMIEAASDLRRRIEQRLSDLEPTPRVTIRGREGKGPLARRMIVIEHVTVVSRNKEKETVLFSPDYSYAQLKSVVKERLSDTMDGIAGRGTDSASVVEDMPVTTERAVQKPSACSDPSIRKYDYEYRKVPAGCEIQVDNGSGGTLGTYAFDEDTYSYVFVSAAHLLDQGGDDVYQETGGDSTDSLGDVNSNKVKLVNSGTDFDAGVIFGLDLNGKYKFAADSPGAYHGPEITGALSENGIKDLQSTDEVMYKQGCHTGLETDDSVDVSGDTFKTMHDECDGDSGGPYWVERNGGTEALITGIHHGRTSGFYSLATMMPSIESEFSLIV